MDNPMDTPSAMLRNLVLGLCSDGSDALLVKSPRRRYVVYRKDNYIRVIPEAREAPCTWKAVRRIDQDTVDPITALFAENARLVNVQKLPIEDPTIKSLLARLPDSQRTNMTE